MKLAPREPLARLQLARVEESSGDWTAAVEQYRALREMKPDEPEYAYGLGNAYLRFSEWCLRRAATRWMAARPASTRRRDTTTACRGGRTWRSRPSSVAAEADPTLPEVHLAMAQIHMEQKRWAEARQEIERELADRPGERGGAGARRAAPALEASAP